MTDKYEWVSKEIMEGWWKSIEQRNNNLANDLGKVMQLGGTALHFCNTEVDK